VIVNVVVLAEASHDDHCEQKDDDNEENLEVKAVSVSEHAEARHDNAPPAVAVQIAPGPAKVAVLAMADDRQET
jgi:hypothetical protein